MTRIGRRETDGRMRVAESGDSAPAATDSLSPLQTTTVSGVSFGVAALSRKGEDEWALQQTPSAVAFGIFDGHTGGVMSAACAKSFLPRILGYDRLPSTKALADAFWAIDEEVGVTGTMAGTTATVLVVGPSKVGDGLSCVLAWVGDSTAIQVDMNLGGVVMTTADHASGSKMEQARITRLQKVRALVDDGQVVEQALASVPGPRLLGCSGEEEEAALVRRALERAATIERSVPEAAAEGSSRKNAFCMPRSSPTKQGPPVVATQRTHLHPGYYDLQMTRSLGDWKGPDLVLPHPDELRFTVGQGVHLRCGAQLPPASPQRNFVAALSTLLPPAALAAPLPPLLPSPPTSGLCPTAASLTVAHGRAPRSAVIASDGLWDVCSHALAAQLCRVSDTPQLAADRLLRHAEVEYFDRGHPVSRRCRRCRRG